MSVVSPQDRLAGAWNFSAVHSAIAGTVEGPTEDPTGNTRLGFTLSAELEFIRAA